MEHQEKIWPANSKLDAGEESEDCVRVGEALVRATQRVDMRRRACDEGKPAGEPIGRLIVRMEVLDIGFSL